MRKTILFLSLGYIGYMLYNKYSNASVLSKGSGNRSNGNGFSDANNYPSDTKMTFDPKIESQIKRGEGMTDEAKVGIND